MNIVFPAGAGEVRQWLQGAGHIAVLTGAGISAESGVPTFRDTPTGYWAQFRAEDMATEAGFRAHPGRVWDWYQHRRDLLAGVQPHAGHVALADFQRHYPGRLTLITQNVDGLHQRAGSTGVLCLHGDIFANRWLDTPRNCCHIDHAATGHPPYCSRCGNLLRPGVVWFGEALPYATLEAAQQAARACDLMLVVGTAGAVYPAAGLAQVARQAGARVVIVNPAASALDDVAHVLLRGTAASVLPVLLAAA
ncbi:SIR2 family NAD-dependent protein deacylase [Acidovorax soli]|uniref:SIR2 family NAD-dependent protein deacylase n=1 Tax=Acidovorax soli TaxID=592050 RepID=UPI000B89E74D|nr:NAD-dependent deacylase [Acidovorax soli]